MSSQASVADAQPADRKAPASPPARSPFEVIHNLEQSMKDDDQLQKKRSKTTANTDGNRSPADGMPQRKEDEFMNQEQYLQIYEIADIKDANVINRKLRKCIH